MRLLMNVSKDRHGTYYAVKKVPVHLQEAVARVLSNGKARQTWLKRSLGTKDVEQANRIAKPVLIEFDRTLDRARALIAERPLRTTLSPVEIKRMTDYYYAAKLASHDEYVQTAPEQEAEFRKLDLDDETGLAPVPEFGLSGGQMFDVSENLPPLILEAEAALARGDLAYADFQIEMVLDAFQINLDRKSAAYRELGIAILRVFVKALRAIQQRHAGEPIETPPLPAVNSVPLVSPGSATLFTAFEGWKRALNRSPRTAQEYEYAIKLFGELHGDMPLAAVRKSHARQFREALQAVPIKRFRTGKLRTATLPELAAWGREHTNARKIGAGTINKLLGALQSVGRWARKEDIVPEDWTDPFADMRVDGDESERGPFEVKELRAIFGAPVFTEGHRPEGGKGEAAFWLPLLALFTGARLGELAGLRASDLVHDASVGKVCIYITPDAKAGKRLKTKQSARAIPIHSQLIELGFITFVAAGAKSRGERAWLFPQVAPETTGAPAYSKWFGRYIGAQGVTDTAKVFHSFRHNFTDALRVAGVGEDVARALVGHTQGGVHGRYGAKEMAARYRHRLAEAIAGVAYAGLDLSHVANQRATHVHQRSPSAKGSRRGER
jgi:integrase